MRNIRLDSLPADRQVANQNCQTCTKRRIKCDRSIPSCEKCASRGLSCPGYNLLLRWDQGVASRGKLTGKKIPLLSPNKTSNRPALSADGAADAPRNFASTSSHGFAQSDSSPRKCETHKPILEERFEPFDRHSSQIFQGTLIHHFHHKVASRLAWLDGPNNPWRNLVLPLAQRSDCLHLSILSLAAAHMSVTSSDCGSHDTASLLQVHHNLRDACLNTLNTKINSELNSHYTKTDGNPGTSSMVEIIATMLSLCYGEMLIPDSTDWKLHLHGCRTSLERYISQRPQCLPRELLAQFLIEEVVYLEAFSTISTFTRTTHWKPSAPARSGFDDQFWVFTELLYEITTIERERFNATQEGYEPPAVDMNTWQAKLMEAYNFACAGKDSFSIDDEATQACLHVVIRAHYYACLIYSYQALASPTEADQTITPLVKSLFQEILFITTRRARAFSHDMSFLLFIAGTECQTNKQWQQLVHTLFIESISATGFSCNNAVLKFLCAFWDEPGSQGAGKWIEYARQNEQGISSFMVF